MSLQDEGDAGLFVLICTHPFLWETRRLTRARKDPNQSITPALQGSKVQDCSLMPPPPPYNKHRTFPQRTWNLDKWGPLCVYISIYCILCNVPVKQSWKFVWNIISNKVGNLFAFCTCMPYTQYLWMKLNASWHQNESSKSFVGGVGKLVVTAEAKEPCGTCTNMQPVGDDQLNTSSGVSNLRRDWPVVIAASVCVT